VFFESIFRYQRGQDVSDIRHSIGSRGGGYPEERMNNPLYAEQLNRVREGEHGPETLQNPKSKLFHFATALFSLRKFIGEFTESSKRRAASINKQKALEDLAAFKTVLEELGLDDKSHEPEFTQRLSLLWQNVCENCSGLEDSVAHLDALAAQILNFVREISLFPPGEDHTLGYYLTEHAGQEWIPFPFMNLLAELHEEFHSSPETSKLRAWIQQLADIIGNYGNSPF
jgi:hypothetical protein